MSNSVIRQIKQEIADVLEADPYFASIPVMPIVANDVQSQLQAGQYRASALTVFIDWLSLANSDPDSPGPWFRNGIFTAEVYEIPAMNLTGPDVDEVAENVANALHLAMLESQNSAVVEGITKLDNDEFGNNLRIIRIGFPFGFKPRVLPQISPVVISPLTQGNQVVTLSCATPGAAIYYTLDGTYPSPRNPSSVLIANTYMAILTEGGSPILTDGVIVVPASVNITSGQTIKARGWLSGYCAATPDFSQFTY